MYKRQDYVGTEVVFELPDDVEKAGYSTASKARLNGSKLKKLGWKMRYSIEVGLQRTIDILRAVSYTHLDVYKRQASLTVR